MRLALTVMLLVTLGCAGCAHQAPTSAGGIQSQEGRPTADVTRVPVSSVAPRIPVQPGVSAVAPLSTADSAQSRYAQIFASPTSAGVEWLRQWCAYDWREPMNSNLDRASQFQTTSAAKDERRTGDDENTYKVARAQQLTSGCDELAATPSPEAPSSGNVAYLVLSARRVNSAAGVAFESEQVRSVRRVLLQADGRWLVDEQVAAG
jgi:hypothetical protein